MEYYKICNACGKGFAFTDEDIKNNNLNTTTNIISGIGAVAGSLSGNWGGTIANQQNKKDIKNFNKCPYCGSERLREVDDKEFERINKRLQGNANVLINTNASFNSLLKRTRLLIDEGEWYEAEAYCNYMLDLEPDNPNIYELQLLSELYIKNLDDAPNQLIDIRKSKSYNKLEKYANSEYKIRLKRINEEYEENLRRKQKDEDNKKNEEIYKLAMSKTNSDIVTSLEEAKRLFGKIPNYKDSKEKYYELESKIKQIEENDKNKKSKMYKIIGIILGIVVILILIIIMAVYIPRYLYTKKFKEHVIGSKYYRDWKEAETIYAFEDEHNFSKTTISEIHGWYVNERWTYSIEPLSSEEFLLTLYSNKSNYKEMYRVKIDYESNPEVISFDRFSNEKDEKEDYNDYKKISDNDYNQIILKNQ